MDDHPLYVAIVLGSTCDHGYLRRARTEGA